jgi:hypothetical protein
MRVEEYPARRDPRVPGEFLLRAERPAPGAAPRRAGSTLTSSTHSDALDGHGSRNSSRMNAAPAGAVVTRQTCSHAFAGDARGSLGSAGIGLRDAVR